MLFSRRALSHACVLATSLMPSLVDAGAWTLPEGQGQLIGTSSRLVAPVRAWFGGVAETDKATSQLFVEYGAWDDLTVGVTLSGEYTLALDNIETRLGGHVRHRFWTSDAGDVLSAQFGVSVPIERWFGDRVISDETRTAAEVDLRVLYGRGWQWDWGNSFVSGELGLRVRGERLDEQLRFDATVGHEPLRGLLFLTSVFSSFPLGNQDEVSIKLSPSLAYTLWPNLGKNDKKPWQPISPQTLQLGVTWDAARPGSGLEVGISVWRPF